MVMGYRGLPDLPRNRTIHVKNLLTFVLFPSLAGGCAVGYGVGTTRGGVSASASPRSGIIEDQAHDVSTMYQEFRLIDSTGLLLAGLVSTGRQYNARADAMKDPSKWTPNNDGTVTVEYSYTPMPILSGIITDARLRLPLGTPSYDGMTNEALSYWAFDLRSEVFTFRMSKSLPMVSSVFLGALFGKWKRPQPSDVDFDAVTIDLTAGTSTSYVIGENLLATGRLGIGLLSPLFGALSGGGKLNPTAELEVGWRPWSNDKYGVMVSGTAEVSRQFAVDKNIFAQRVGLNVAVTFGNQVPKKARQQPSSAATPAATASMSGNICAGAAPSPECLEVNTAAPEPVKILFIACAQATVNAATANNFDTQPATCRTAGQGIWKYAKENDATMTPEQKKASYVAAAGAYDFAAAGYELSQGKLTAEHCAMIELTHGAVIGPDGNNPVLAAKVKDANDAVSQCRAKFTCTYNDGDETCAPK